MRFAAAMWLVLALLLQTFAGLSHATSMAAGAELCSADGHTTRVRVDGGEGADAGAAVHDCCLSAAAGAPPVVRQPALTALRFETPAAVLTSHRLGAGWLGPLSRGPPLFL